MLQGIWELLKSIYVSQYFLLQFILLSVFVLITLNITDWYKHQQPLWLTELRKLFPIIEIIWESNCSSMEPLLIIFTVTKQNKTLMLWVTHNGAIKFTCTCVKNLCSSRKYQTHPTEPGLEFPSGVGFSKTKTLMKCIKLN